MNTHIIEIFQNVSIFVDLNGNVTGSFNQNININFIPDIMKVITFRYIPPAAEGFITTIYSDIVNEPLFNFTDNSYDSPQHVILLNGKPVNGSHFFNIRDVTGNINIGRQGELFFILQFIKYKDIKQEKIY